MITFKHSKTWWVATALLLLVVMLFTVSLMMTRHSDAWGWAALKAFAEAAMVGALADWFAVVALFEHPMGVPIPHTAILRNNQQRVAESITRFFCESFLNERDIKEKVEALQPSQKLLTALKSSEKGVLDYFRTGLLKLLLPMLQDEELRLGMAKHAGNFLKELPLEKAAAFLLQGAARTDMPEEAMDFALSEAQGYIRAHQAELSAAVEKQMMDSILPSGTGMAFQPIVSVLGIGNRVVEMIDNYVNEVRRNKEHPLRRDVVGIIRNNLEQSIEPGSSLMNVLQGAKENFLLPKNLFWLLDSAGSRLKQYSEDADDAHEGLFRHVVFFMEEYPDCGRMLDTVLAELACQNIPALRDTIGQYLYDTVMSWNIDEMIEKIREQVGDDLQFIRMNGTIIGGLIGLLIYVATCLF